jgi:Uma2 family endonuclease
VTALEDWIDRHPDGLTVEDYEALPEEVSRRIEIVDGAVVVSPSPHRDHQDAAVELRNVLKAAGKPDYRASVDLDLRLRDVPLLNRRPDVAVYDPKLRRDQVLRAQHCLLVVEVMSPGSVSTDQFTKPGEYAGAGIRHFWRLELLDASPVLYRYRLDPGVGARTYVLVGKDTGLVTVTDPLRLTIDLDDLY